MNKTRFFTFLAVLAFTCCLFVPQASAQSLSSPRNSQHHAVSAATSTCWEASCNGTDPYKDGCAGSGASYKVLLSTYIRDNSGTIVGYVQL